MPAVDLATLTTLLARVVDELPERLRRRTPGWWSGASACAGWTRADGAHHLVDTWASFEQGVVGVARDQWRTPPMPAHPLALPDMITVVGRDLVSAVGATKPGATVRHPYRHVGVEFLAAAAVCEGAVHGWDLDGTVPDADVAAALVPRLFPSAPAESEPDGRALLRLCGRGRGAAEQWDWEWDER